MSFEVFVERHAHAVFGGGRRAGQTGQNQNANDETIANHLAIISAGYDRPRLVGASLQRDGLLQFITKSIEKTDIAPDGFVLPFGVSMYHMIIRKRVTSVFERLNQGDYEYALSGVGTTIEHRFAGEHCLGGSRTSATAMRRWFQRLFRLFPNLRFEIHAIAASGAPWDTTVIVEWTDRATPADGKDYVNSGAHVIRMRWGRVVSIHAYLDTQILIGTLNRMAVNGIDEAHAPPITG